MAVTITSAADGQILHVMGEELRPLTPPGRELSVEVFETSAPAVAPGAAGPPPHRHPWDEINVVQNGTMAVINGTTWREAKSGTCVCVPAGQWHAYRNGTADCRFLTITGPGRGREFFERVDAEITTFPPDMDRALALAARHDLEVMQAG